MNPIIIGKLKDSAQLHVAAIVVYQQQAIHLKEWGYAKLAARIAADAEEERGHLNRLIARLEFMDEPQDLPPQPTPVWPRHDMLQMLTVNLMLERQAAQLEREGIRAACDGGDEGTAEVFRENLQGSEDGVQAFKADLKVIEQVGLQNYLTAQV